jgi:hypothetical protein
MGKEKLVVPISKVVKKSITKILNEPIQLGLFNKADNIPVSKLAALETPAPVIQPEMAGQVPFEGGQLPLWLRGGDLKNIKVADYETNPFETSTQMFFRKLDEAKKSGLYDSVKESGVQTPVQFSTYLNETTPVLTDGYHRFVSAANVGEDTVIPYTLKNYSSTNQLQNIQDTAKAMGFKADDINAFNGAPEEVSAIMQDFISSGDDITNAIRGKDLRTLSTPKWLAEHQTDFMNYLFTRMPRMDAIKFAIKYIQPYVEGGM